MSKGHEQVMPRKRKEMAVKYMKCSTALIMKFKLKPWEMIVHF